jgi:hypothetical protein
MTCWRSKGRSPGFQSDAVWTTRAQKYLYATFAPVADNQQQRARSDFFNHIAAQQWVSTTSAPIKDDRLKPHPVHETPQLTLSFWLIIGGGRGIRTPGTVAGSVVFKTTAIDHSAIPPRFHSTNRATEYHRRRRVPWPQGKSPGKATRSFPASAQCAVLAKCLVSEQEPRLTVARL